jgi:hypothetical protein
MGFFQDNKKSIRQWAVVLGMCVSVIAIPSCSTTKKVAEASPDKPLEQPPTGKLKAEDFLNRNISWNTFNGKADMHFERQDQSQNVSCNLKMNKGKDIWASIIALGILEAARAKITPDSLRAIYKIDKVGYALSYKEGQELIGTQVEFPALQRLLIGNPLVDASVPVTKFEPLDSTVVITQVKDDFTQVLTYNKKTMTLQELQLNSTAKHFKCTIRYEKYAPITLQQPFAFNRFMVIDDKGSIIKLNLEFSRAELDMPVETTFSIPTSYEMKSIPKKN